MSPRLYPHRECLNQRLTAAGLGDRRHAQSAQRILTSIDRGICPRCGAALGDLPARSHITKDRCIPVCGECGSHEGVRQLAANVPAETIADWLLDASEVRAQLQAVRRRLDGHTKDGHTKS